MAYLASSSRQLSDLMLARKHHAHMRMMAARAVRHYLRGATWTKTEVGSYPIGMTMNALCNLADCRRDLRYGRVVAGLPARRVRKPYAWKFTAEGRIAA